MRLFVTRRTSLRALAFGALRDALLTSPLIGDTTLNGPFKASRGFAMTFTEAGRATLEQRFPSLVPHLADVLGRPAVRALTPWWRRVRALPNAWYLNVLLVGEGATVKRHIDATLATPAGLPDTPPLVVSVLYLTVPSRDGGELLLWRGSESVGGIRPKEGAVVHFRGDLAHQVQPFRGGAGQLRASLVIEQYRFDDAALSRLPAFKLDSRAGFDAHLAALSSGPATTFERD